MDFKELRNLHEAYMDVYSVDEELTGERAERAKEIMKGSRPYGRKRASTDTKYNAAKRALTAGEGSTKSPSRDIKGDQKLPTSRGGGGIKGRAKTVTQSNGSQTDRGRGNRATRRSGGDVENTRYEESYDLYDIILSHLLDEGYAETPEAAEEIMVNMSEDWRVCIVEEILDEELTGSRSERAREIMRSARPQERSRKSTDTKYNAAKRALTAGEGSTKSPSRDIRGDEKLPTGRGGRGIKGRAKTVTQAYGGQSDRGRGNRATRRSGGDVEDTRYDD